MILDDNLILEIEDRAAEMAKRAGEIVQSHFGRQLEVEYKGKGEKDPVTSADKESQAYLSEGISRFFPSHGILGEEGPEEDGAAPDFLWVLDPLDGTTNFLNGLPIYAVSIGVLHRGRPIAGAIFIPWHGDGNGCVLRARRGGGARMGDVPIEIPSSEGPQNNRLTGLPGSFGARFRVGKDLRRRVGEVRVTGSIAYELAMTACGAFQYAMFGGPKIWDVAAGVLVVTEAGGTVLVWERKRRSWKPMTTLGPSWEVGPPSLKEVRDWTSPVIAGSAQVAPFVAANLRRRFPMSARVARLLRVLAPRKR